MKTLLPLLLIIPSLSWGKEVYLSCKIISKMLWGSEEYEVKEFYDEQNINLLVKNRSLIIDDYQNFSFSVDGREVDGDILIGDEDKEYYFDAEINKTSEDDTSITYSFNRKLTNIGDNKDSDVTYNFQFIINKYTLDTTFKEFFNNIIERSEGSLLGNETLEEIESDSNNYRMKCESKKPVL